VFKKTNSTYMLKMKASRAVLTEVNQKFGPMPFNLRAMEDEKKARMGIVECASHGLVMPYEVFAEKEGSYLFFFPFSRRADFIAIQHLQIPESLCVTDRRDATFSFSERGYAGEFVAQFAFTVLILPSGPLKITNPPFDPTLIKSENTIVDEAINALLATEARAKKKTGGKKKKAKKPSAGASTDAKAEEEEEGDDE
jgi:hypothetical protein